MQKFSLSKVQTVMVEILVLVAGIIGIKALKGLVESKFPMVAPYINWVLLSAALVGTTMVSGKPIIQGASKGALLFASVQLLNQFIPSGASKYLPSINGVKGVRGLGNYPVQIPDSAVTLGNAVSGGIGNMVM